MKVGEVMAFAALVQEQARIAQQREKMELALKRLEDKEKRLVRKRIDELLKALNKLGVDPQDVNLILGSVAIIIEEERQEEATEKGIALDKKKAPNTTVASMTAYEDQQG